MRLYLDANVVISVLNKEYPLFTYSSRVMSLADRPGFEVFTSPLVLAIAFYFASKKSGEVSAKKKIDLLTNRIRISTINEAITKKALENPQAHDFEDGLQYYSAMNQACEVIITEDRSDFYFSEIEVLGCEEFMSHYFDR
ncbi:MAG: PIN domain-containing protein [Cytophagales bacterium]|nr:PIN domain-containing protein [Cytophagales bacterium]